MLVNRFVSLCKFPSSFVRLSNFACNACSCEQPSKFTTGKLNHVAIATADFEKHVHLYKNILGLKVSEPTAQVEHGVNTVFVEFGNSKIELLSPLGENSPIKNFLESKGGKGGVHHVCIEVSNIYEAMAKLKAGGFKLLGEKPKIGAHGKLVIFINPKDCGGVLIELEQN